MTASKTVITIFNQSYEADKLARKYVDKLKEMGIEVYMEYNTVTITITERYTIEVGE